MTRSLARSGALAAVLAMVAPGPARPLERSAASRDGWTELDTAAPTFEVRDLRGRALRSEDLRGKVVVIDFWATWCAPCLRELPDLAGYHHRLEGRSDVVLLSFNVTDERADLEAFVEKRAVPFTVYLGDSLIGAFELVAFPTKVVLDMRGRGPGVVRFRREGYTPVASIEARVADLLASP